VSADGGGIFGARVIELRGALSGPRSRAFAATVLAVVVLMLAWEHSGQGAHEMGESMAPWLTTCLAVLTSAIPAALVALAGARRRAVSDRLMSVRRPPRWYRAQPARIPPARAGPALLQSFRC
jgi:hypothetical protein